MDPAASPPSGEVVPDDDAALMAQLGFSSFGTQDRPQKKRRYNPHADASFSAPAAPPASTGANSTSLGARPPPSQPPAAAPAASSGSNPNEISLDDDDDAGGDEVGEAGGPNPDAESVIAGAQVRPASLPQRPAAAPSGFNSGYVHQSESHRGRGPPPPPAENWYEGYYDPSSNENPWSRLEKARGLESRGSWVVRTAEPPKAEASA